MVASYNFDLKNQEILRKKLEALHKATSDFRIPFKLISADFYRSQKQIFALKNRGLYPDLADSTKKQKQSKLGFVYPILVGATRRLSQSTLTNAHPDSIYDLGKQHLVIGTKTPYGKYHQSDLPRTRIPLRKFIFISGGPEDKAKDAGIGRIGRWSRIIEEHIKQLIEGI